MVNNFIRKIHGTRTPALSISAIVVSYFQLWFFELVIMARLRWPLVHSEMIKAGRFFDLALSENGEAVKVGYRDEDGKKVRFSKKSEKAI